MHATSLNVLKVIGLLGLAAAIGGCSPGPVSPGTGQSGPRTITSPTASKEPSSMNTPTTKLSTNSPATAADQSNVKAELATFGAGCFWGVEAKFRKVPGVIDTAVGYTGGMTLNPTYKDVCTDTTGHAEVVEVKFDPSKVSYQKLLEVYFGLHDPTQVDRQGPDYGNQYRTEIFAHSKEQMEQAKAYIAMLDASKKFRKPIATKVSNAGIFYRAEEYHQRYLEKQGLDSCGTGH